MLNLEKLENVVVKNGKTSAACPACRDDGHDRCGNHLIIFEGGKFGCVRFGGASPEAVEHRKNIARLAGDGKASTPSKPAPDAFLKLPNDPKGHAPIPLLRFARNPAQTNPVPIVMETESKSEAAINVGRFGRSFETLTRSSTRAPACAKSLKRPSEPSETISVTFNPGAMDGATSERLRLIEGILSLRDGKGRAAYTQSQIDSCIIALRGFADDHPANREMMTRLNDARKNALSWQMLADRMMRGHRA